MPEYKLRGARPFYGLCGALTKQQIEIPVLLKQEVLSPKGLPIFMLLADGMEIPNLHFNIIRFENKKDANNPQFVITCKASWDEIIIRAYGFRNFENFRLRVLHYCS